VFFYDVEHPLLSLTFAVVESLFDFNIALRKSSTICVKDCENVLAACWRNATSIKDEDGLTPNWGGANNAGSHGNI
jgi:hypothetical protein